MISVDTSALIAIALEESDKDFFLNIISKNNVVMSAASYVEYAMVMKYRKGNDLLPISMKLIEKLNIQIIPVDEKQARIASLIRLQYPILNYGDTFSYALAKDRGLPLLYKGDDFAKTDLRAAT